MYWGTENVPSAVTKINDMLRKRSSLSDQHKKILIYSKP